MGTDKFPIRYELITGSCGLVPELLVLHGDPSLVSEMNSRRDKYVKLEILGVPHRTQVFGYRPDVSTLSVDAAPLFKLVARAARGA
jgi:hypothetical protein